MIRSKNLALSALFVAIGLVLPSLFHQFQMGGQAFLPMHLPVLLGGLLLGPWEGLMIGMVTPVLSSLLTSMPPLFPTLPIMFLELSIYGLAAGYLRKRLGLNIYLSLIGAMVLGRIAAGLVVFVLIRLFAFQAAGPLPYLTAAVVTGLPGIAIQLVVLPLLALFLEKNLPAFRKEKAEK